MVTIRQAKDETQSEAMDTENVSAKLSELADELQQLGFRSERTGVSGPSSSGATDGTKGDGVGKPENEKLSFDSDDEESLPFGTVDPFYDEHADSEDETWVREELLGGCEAEDVTASVSCPSCFALLSMQVQQHVQYEGQFRAICVTNCKIIEKERLHITTDRLGRRPKKGEVFKPVVCRKCDTEVAVLDVDDVYHFCNVIY